MTDTQTSLALQRAESGRSHIEYLLTKYPETNESENFEILSYLENSSAFDVAILTCNDAVSDNLRAFKRDNDQQLGLTLQGWACLAGLVAIVALSVYFLWDIGT